MKKTTAALLLLLLAALALCCTGCFGKVIQEDAVQTDLPDIDPEDGVAKEVAVTLYYRLTNEEYLVGVNRSVSVRASERTETAVIRTLIEGVPLLAADVSALFPANTSIADVTYESGILYVTLSNEFLDEAAVSSIERKDYLNDESYAAAVQAARSEMYIRRRLGVLSIVNTIAVNGGDVMVQFMVDIDGSGTGTRLPYSELGIDGYGTEIIEPLGFDDTVIAAEDKVCECLFKHLVDGEYEMAYALIAESDATGATKPTYADFETEMMTLGTVDAFAVHGVHRDEQNVYVMADVRFTAASGLVKNVTNAKIYLADEGDLSKVGYGSLKAIMES